MSWALSHVARLLNGETVSFRPRGKSMEPRIGDGALVTCDPIRDREIRSGDVVPCAVRGRQLVHLVSATRSDGQLQISNNKGRVNGRITRRAVYGVVTKVEATS